MSKPKMDRQEIKPRRKKSSDSQDTPRPVIRLIRKEGDSSRVMTVTNIIPEKWDVVSISSRFEKPDELVLTLKVLS